MQITHKLANFSTRLTALGRRADELARRIEIVKNRPTPCPVTLRRLERETRRLHDEMRCYEELLRSLSQCLQLDDRARRPHGAEFG